MRALIVRALLALLGFAGPAAAQPVAQEPIVRPARLCIYYGWPSAVNGSGGNVAAATTHFLKCDVIVFPDGVEHPAHGDHAATREIVANLVGASRKVFGYVDLGVSTQNLTIAQMQGYVDEWRQMGASGIFFDDAGFDYKVTRARQNAMIDYVHAQGMPVFLNAWEIDDVLGDLDENGAPSPTRVRAGDWYLAESWLVGGGRYMSPPEWAVKADKALAYARTKDVKIAAVSTAPAKKALAGDAATDKFKMAWWGAAMYALAAWQWTDIGYSSADAVLRTYAPAPGYGGAFLGPVVHASKNTLHTRPTNIGTITVSGNGVRRGTGQFK